MNYINSKSKTNATPITFKEKLEIEKLCAGLVNHTKKLNNEFSYCWTFAIQAHTSPKKKERKKKVKCIQKTLYTFFNQTVIPKKKHKILQSFITKTKPN